MFRETGTSAIIVGLGTITGLLYAAAFSDTPWVPKPPTPKPSGVVIDAAGLMKLVEQNAIIIDARKPEQFEQGHLDAPTIINVHPDHMGENVDRLTPDVVGERAIVIYCQSTECDMAERVFDELQSTFGYGPPPGGTGVVDMFIYTSGWAGITENGRPTVSGGERWTEPGEQIYAESPDSTATKLEESAEPNESPREPRGGGG